MKKMTTNEIRNMWLDFFKEKEHHVEESKSLVPVNDNSLLFINSGVATLKKYFDGSEVPPSNRIVNAQKSIRTNDIENVGVTSRHHTLFEMLGNFSIGDYFKEETIEWALELLTSEKWFNFDVEKLYFTIHPEDEFAYDKWIKLGIAPNKIIRLEENFWEIGKGPGGPNSEIFYDRGEQYDERDPYVLIAEDIENDRIIEIWNLVFSQYNCDPGILLRSEYNELPQKNIDTGMGLERLASIIQEVDTNFETDNFMVIINALVNVTGLSYEDYKMAYRVISDHIRALTFAIADGALPSNEGRGYVLRRILRRAVRFGYHDLGLRSEFLYKLVDEVVNINMDFYPYLDAKRDFVKEVILGEETKFLSTIEGGIKLLNTEISKLKGNNLDGKVAFQLYDTFGFPIELTIEVCEEKNITVDVEGFNNHLEEQRNRARNAMKTDGAINLQNPIFKEIEVASEFVGYNTLEVSTEVVLLTDLDYIINSSKNSIYAIINPNPFYAESGGQVSDIGYLGTHKVVDVQKIANGQHLLQLEVNGEITIGETLDAKVDSAYRNIITTNHSGTHLLHYALHKVLGEHASQAGSYQDASKTRFDFTNLKAMTPEQITEVEAIVNDMIKANIDVDIRLMCIEEAKSIGAAALFGEKYGDVVRVVKMDDAIELCGGTHVKNTSDIKYFHILSESGIGSGVRRIEAITNTLVVDYTMELVNSFEIELEKIEDSITKKVVPSINVLTDIYDKAIRANNVYPQGVSAIIAKYIETKNVVENFKVLMKNAEVDSLGSIKDELIKTSTVYMNCNLIDQEVKGVSPKKLKELADTIANELADAVIILKVVDGDKVTVVVKVAENLVPEHNASLILKKILEEHGGRGGGKPTMAQGSYSL